MAADTKDPLGLLRLLAVGTTALLTLAYTYNNLSTVQYSLAPAQPTAVEAGGAALRAASDPARDAAADPQEVVPFTMCDRRTPFSYEVDPRLPPADRKAIIDFEIDWPRDNGILLLRNDGKFGHIGNQVNSLLHSYDYARDHRLDLGMLFHSWAMDVIQTMFYETSDFDDVGRELRADLGILVVRNQSQLEGYDEVVSQNAQQLYFYKSGNVGMDHWKETMGVHIAFLRRLFLRYNRGYGYVHNGLRAQDACATLNMFFHERVGEVKYTVSEYCQKILEFCVVTWHE